MFLRKKQTQTASVSPGKSAIPTPRPEWNLQTVAQRLTELAPALETKDIEPLLIQARLADTYRDLNLQPVPAPEFDHIVEGLDTECWRRLALAVGALDHTEIRSALATLTTPVAQQVQVGFVGMARQTDALTVSLIRQSDVRTEEFARHLAFHLGVFWRGESAEQSKQRLRQLDYKRLLAEADQAKKQAEERMEYLRRMQEADTARRRPRGK